MNTLTAIQKDTLGYIMAFVEDFGYPPTYREIGDRFGITLQAVTDRLLYIEKKGYISRDGKAGSRAIAVLKNTNGNKVKLKWVV